MTTGENDAIAKSPSTTSSAKSDPGDRGVERRSQAAGRPRGHQRAHALLAESAPLRDHRSEGGTDLDHRALAAGAPPGSERQGGGRALHQRDAPADPSAAHEERLDHLGDAVAARVAREEPDQGADEQPADRRHEDDPPHRCPGGGLQDVRARPPEHPLHEGDQLLHGHRAQAGRHADDGCEQEEPQVLLAPQPPHPPPRLVHVPAGPDPLLPEAFGAGQVEEAPSGGGGGGDGSVNPRSIAQQSPRAHGAGLAGRGARPGESSLSRVRPRVLIHSTPP